MANAEIVQVGMGELDLIRELYNQMFVPSQPIAYFERRLNSRKGVLILLAQLDKQPVGFTCGYELRPSTYYAWLCGVVHDARRLGVASQLLAAEQAWARESGYEMMRFECGNLARPMILVAIRQEYNIVGIRWDSRSDTNLVIFEKNLQDVE
jgi:GNAT superfamily N-acetyltransferase